MSAHYYFDLDPMKIVILTMSRTEAEMLSRTLESAGYDCRSFDCAADFLEQLHVESGDLLILDAAITNYIEVVQQLKCKRENALPILLLADEASTDGVVGALSVGVDDYLLKPLRSRELLARVRILLCRKWPEKLASSLFSSGHFLFDVSALSLTADGQSIKLTQKEFDLALLFFRNLGKPLSRAYLLETIWSQDMDVPSRSMDTHVSRVRSKLHLQPENGFRLVPVYGYGYLLEAVPT